MIAGQRRSDRRRLSRTLGIGPRNARGERRVAGTWTGPGVAAFRPTAIVVRGDEMHGTIDEED